MISGYEYGGRKMDRGYSCSPIAYKNTVILTLGGQGQTLIAFNQKDGTIAWKNQTLDMSPSSPIIVNVDGQDQTDRVSRQSRSWNRSEQRQLTLESSARHRMGTEHQHTGLGQR